MFVNDDIAAVLDAFDNYLKEAQTDGVLRADASTITEPMRGLDRVPEDKQTEGRRGIKGFIAALLMAFKDWTQTKTFIGGAGGAPPYQNGFAPQTASGADGAYYTRHLDGDVVLGGRILAPTSPGGKSVFSLPAGSRPPKPLWLVVPTDAAAPNNTGTIIIDITGVVTVQTMSNSVSFSLDGIRYRSA